MIDAPSDDQLKALLELCRSSTIAHSEEVMPLLAEPAAAKRRGVRIELHAPSPRAGALGHLQSTYRVRAAILSEKERLGTLCEPSPSGRILPSTLAADVRELSAAIDSAKEQPFAIWDIVLPDHVCFLIFVLMGDNRIAGCVKTIEEVREPSSGRQGPTA
jgi:hypothetical protein